VTYVALALLIAFILQHVLHFRQVGAMLADFSHERQKLLDRIQFPEVRQVEAIHSEPAEIPKDAAEMSFVGGEVPAGVDVGSPPTPQEIDYAKQFLPDGQFISRERGLDA
jgi:hypothetical protein